MLNNKQKQYLKKLSIEEEILKFNVGKSTLNENVYKNLENALNAHEIIKISLLKTSFTNDEEKNELIINLISNLNAEIVNKIGNTIIIYKENKKAKNHIILPK